MADNPLSGCTALITGAAIRVGAAIAHRLHAAGADLLLHYRHSASAATELQHHLEGQRKNSVRLLQADLRDREAVADLAAAAMARSDRIDLLINNASSYYATPLDTVSDDDWDDLFGTNVRAPFLLAQALAPRLRTCRGAIINIVDIHAERPRAGHCLYSMAKAANAMMVKSLARELAPEVRVNGVAPGAVLWPAGTADDTDHADVLRRIPLARPGTPDDVADAVLYLCTAGYVTGEIVHVDGGRSVQQ